MKNFQTKDVYLLLSILNMTLRDESENLEDLCKTYNLDEQEIKDKMAQIDYYYDETTKQFK